MRNNDEKISVWDLPYKHYAADDQTAYSARRNVYG